MSKYLRKKPLIAVPSDIFYRFQARRTQELMNVQFHMARYRPDNYGTISALNMHLIRHVAHSPIAKPRYLRNALVATRFGFISKRFGMFFLIDLDLEHATLGQIVEKDDKECRLAMAQAKTGRTKRLGHTAPENSQPSEQYPLGNAPTWAEIVNTMESNPNLLLKEWVWDPIWDGNGLASELFTDFTFDLMATLDIAIFHEKKMPATPQSLEEAMEFWTISSLQNIFSESKCKFVPSTHHLKRKFPGKDNPGFCDYFDIFFPPLHHTFHTKSVWESFAKKGYIKAYYNSLDEISEDDGETLRSELRKHFGRIQCLPEATLNNSIGRLWVVTDNSLQFLTNPIFYKIERISSGRKMTRQVFRVKASRDILEARLDEHHRGIPFDQSKGEARILRRKKKIALTRKSVKKKNRREPPKRKQKKENSKKVIGDGEIQDEDDGEADGEDEERELDELEEDEDEEQAGEIDDEAEEEIDELQSEDSGDEGRWNDQIDELDGSNSDR
jgi:hypothetical protein